MTRSPLALPVIAVSAALTLTGCAGEAAGDRPVESAASDPDLRPGTFEDPDLGTIAVYEVSTGAVLSPTPDARARSVWDLFVDVATVPEIDRWVVQYDAGDASDGDTLAYVSPVGEDNSEWAFAANLAFADDEDLMRSTIVHEYGHLISLSSDEVQYGADTCQTLDLSEGCAYDDAAIWAFYRDFWEQYGAEAPGTENDDADLAYEFYLSHEDAFVSDYAATNVTEDFAESFMTFVLEDQPTGESAVAEKLNFFWDRDGEPERRDRIRAALGLD